jgi:hypothetical protein
MSGIDLSIVKAVIDDCELLITDLDGQNLDDRFNHNTDKAEAREHKVRLSRDLQRLAHQLELAATLVRNEYWHARGGPDHIYERD